MIFLLLSVFVVWFCVPKQVRAARNIAQTEASQQEELLSDLPLSDIQKVLEQNTDTQDLTFRELVRQLMQDGEYTDKRTLVRQVFDRAFGDVAEGKQLFVQILLLTAACSFLQNFIHVFENSQISKTGFYLYFLLLMGLLLRSYLLIHGILEDVLGQVIDFMEALLPAFCMTMVFCSQKVTAVGFYQLSLIVIYLIDRVLLYIVIPAIHVYVVLQMLNCMTEEKLISRMTVLLKRGLIWVMRLLLAGVTGMNVIERMIAPSVDNLKKMSVTQTISMLPGLGNTAQAVGNIFFGSAVVIRNGIGTAAMIVLVCLALGPLLKMLLYRFPGNRRPHGHLCNGTGILRQRHFHFLHRHTAGISQFCYHLLHHFLYLSLIICFLLSFHIRKIQLPALQDIFPDKFPLHPLFYIFLSQHGK